MLESGPQVTDPPGRHVNTIVDDAQRRAAQTASQGPDGTEQEPLGSADGARALAAGEEFPVTPRPGTWLVNPDNGEGVNNGMPAAAMSSNVGGMGAHWTCACPEPAGAERPSFLDEETLAKAFERARALLHVDSLAFEGAPLAAELRAALAEQLDADRSVGRRVQPMPLATEVRPDGTRYWTGTDVILRTVVDSDRFELRPMTIARQIVMDGDRAVGVEVVDRASGEATVINADVVVVAADPFRSPQLLFASGIRPNALGHYLNDQPQASGTVLLSDRFRPEAQHSDQGEDGGGVIHQLSGVSWVPYQDETFPFHGQIMQMDASPVPLDTSVETWPGSVVEVGLFASKDIRFEDQVEFDESSLDPFGLPRISINYSLTDGDHDRVQQMVDTIEQIGGALGRFVDDAKPFVFPAGSSIHYQGTVRMGPVDDGTSVCDPTSRVWGTANVYVGGNGVIPTPIACNPTLTNVALSVIAATHIAAENELADAQAGHHIGDEQ